MNKKLFITSSIIFSIVAFSFGYFWFSKPVLAATSIARPNSNTQIYGDVEGAKQGKFLGDSLSNKWRNSIEISGLDFDVNTPRDSASGQATGKRQYKPLVITKTISKNSPQFFQASVTNEILKNVTFNFVKTDDKGQQNLYYTITLQNATILEYQNLAGNQVDDAKQPDPREQISFSFQKITITSNESKITTEDDWQSNQV